MLFRSLSEVSDDCPVCKRDDCDGDCLVEPDWKNMYEIQILKRDGYEEQIVFMREELETAHRIIADSDNGVKMAKLVSELAMLKSAYSLKNSDCDSLQEKYDELKVSYAVVKTEHADLCKLYNDQTVELASTQKLLEAAKHVSHPSTAKLDHMLSIQKSSSDHRGLGFVAPSGSSDGNLSKPVSFVKATPISVPLPKP